MTEFLLFTIYAPLASWGEIAVGESRSSWDRPSRSGVLGLVAAALGIEREDQSLHNALDADYGIAVRLDASGTPMTDYHTAQTVAASVVKKKRPATRAALLASVAPGDQETILSRRAYRQDALATIAIWTRTMAPQWSLHELADALRRPRFVLYAGRKANPLGLPLAPVLLESSTLGDALLDYAESRGLRLEVDEAVRVAVFNTFDRLRSRNARSRGWGREVSHDPCEGFESGLDPHRRETRRDSAAHRGRWQFAERVVEVGLLRANDGIQPSSEEEVGS